LVPPRRVPPVFFSVRCTWKGECCPLSSGAPFRWVPPGWGIAGLMGGGQRSFPPPATSSCFVEMRRTISSGTVSFCPFPLKRKFFSKTQNARSLFFSPTPSCPGLALEGKIETLSGWGKLLSSRGRSPLFLEFSFLLFSPLFLES